MAFVTYASILSSSCFISSSSSSALFIKPTTSSRDWLCPLQYAASRHTISDTTAVPPIPWFRAKVSASAVPSSTSVRVNKRLAVFSDGTWQTAMNETPTNILKLCTALKSEDSNGIQQVVMYDAGVGSGNDVEDSDWWGKLQNKFEKVTGGYFGYGIDANIKQLYTFLASNYDDVNEFGDEIYLFGFSRGAYTVRSLAGFISHCGLLKRNELSRVHKAYEAYRSKMDPESIEEYLNIKMRKVNITLLACFDTVGDLGIPQLSSNWRTWSRYKFHDITLSERIKNAIHILSVDEERQAYQPSLMQKPDGDLGNEVNLIQLFFPGDHSGVGGGNEDEQEVSDNALYFLVTKIQDIGLKLEFDMENLSKGSAFGKVTQESTSLPTVPRHIGSIDDCHKSVVSRYRKVLDWRPRALQNIATELERADI